MNANQPIRGQESLYKLYKVKLSNYDYGRLPGMTNVLHRHMHELGSTNIPP